MIFPMSQQEPDKKNIVDLAEARKRQRTVRAGATTRFGKGKDGGGGERRPVRRFWIYLQFLLFLAVLAYMMQRCRGDF
jgi:hypothetical protein